MPPRRNAATVYFDDDDPGCAAWLRRLYPGAKVDRRSIHAIQPEEIQGYQRVHLFGGIGGWELALRLAGFPPGRPVLTGSPPCQPFSSAGRRKGYQDPRDLWS